MSKVNINNIDLDELDDDIFDELYEEDDNKGLRKFRDGGEGKKRKKTPRKKESPKNS